MKNGVVGQAKAITGPKTEAKRLKNNRFVQAMFAFATLRAPELLRIN